jgi:hypothetical protein
MSALMWYWAVPGLEVGRGLLAVDGPPREQRPPLAQFTGPLPGPIEHAVPEAQQVPGDPRLGVRQQRQDIDLGVPEVVALIARSGLALGRDADPFGPPGRLGHLVEVPPNGLLEPHRVDLGLHADVGAVPEAVQLRTLAGQELIEAVTEHAVQGPAAPSDELRHRDTA